MMRDLRRRAAPFATLLVTGWLATGCDSPKPFEIQGKILENKDVSAITCGDDGIGILAADEGAAIQTARFRDDGRTADIEREILLDAANPEADFEGAAFMDGWFYVTGSHGAAKKKGIYGEERARVYRLRLADGAAARIEKTSLAPLLARTKELAPFHMKPLQAKGVNIEGLSARDGELYFGFRAPNLDGDAIVLRVNAAALFADPGKAEGRLFRLPVGTGLGIRAIEPYADGFLLVAGNAGSEPSKSHPNAADFDEHRASELFHWNPRTEKLVKLATLPRAGKGKEEGLLVLPAKDGAPAEVLVLYDGIAGGGAVRLPIPSIP